MSNNKFSEKVAAMKQRGLIEAEPQLPLWQDAYRALPNDIARSALFTIRNKRTPRAAMQGQRIYHLHDKITVRFTGVELRASDDELVWMQILNYAKDDKLGNEFKFTLFQLCKDIGWPTTGHYYAKTEACLERLRAGVFFIDTPAVGSVDLPLIAHFRRDKTSPTRAVCSVTIDPKTVLLFNNHRWTRVLWDKYTSLSDLGRRLYDYVASHENPNPLDISKLKQVCASDCKSNRDWRAMVKKACTEIEKKELVRAIWIKEQNILCVR